MQSRFTPELSVSQLEAEGVEILQEAVRKYQPVASVALFSEYGARDHRSQ